MTGPGFLSGLLGLAGTGEVLFQLATVKMPEGDPEDCRQAAAYLRNIADRVASAQRTANTLHGAVVKDAHNMGLAIDEFDDFHTKRLTHLLSSLHEGINHLADSCDEFGHQLEQHERALKVLEIQMVANIIFCVSYGYMAGFAGMAAERAMIWRLVLQARGQAKLWEAFVLAFTHRLLERMAYFVVLDSIQWAVAQQAVQIGIYELADTTGYVDRKTMNEVAGYDVLDWKTNIDQVKREFVANVAFDLTMEGLGRSKAGRYFDRGSEYWRNAPKWKPALAGFAGRMSGSLAYSATNDAQTGDWSNFTDPDKLWQMMFQKTLIHGTRIGVYPASRRPAPAG
ncbi:hypothetical protein NE235_03035 [Actinoallomurus spadix]|nr:hypothetical protein [Actinoallomurus spadix]MCO5985079.1 hypothetical protein [Actinoallomurus spadix]